MSFGTYKNIQIIEMPLDAVAHKRAVTGFLSLRFPFRAKVITFRQNGYFREKVITYLMFMYLCNPDFSLTIVLASLLSTAEHGDVE